MRKVITVDGLAGSGKSSISAKLAARLGFKHLSSGLLYRGLALLAIRSKTPFNEEKALCKLLSEHTLTLGTNQEGSSTLFIDGKPPVEDLLSDEISRGASFVAPFAEVRKHLVLAQREAYPGYGIVAEGRDMGTVIFPDADMKFFIVVDPEVRAKRRLAQIGGKGEDVLREILARDEKDTSRAISPAVAASDAVTIDNSHETLENVVEILVDHLKQRGILTP